MSWWLSFVPQKNGHTLTERLIFAWCAMGPNSDLHPTASSLRSSAAGEGER